ncbi:MAG: 1-acyl-sn-glycerol-3-phosphate acyltransferase [Gemmatimonadota bacterium]|nr:MAG: 1-acyl-sn-glycerol-3-phosphate acyltransferase [Gemmatimonadota bacterium]
MIARLSRLAVKAATWALDHFYEVGQLGRGIPEGPALVIANHPNSVMDGLVVLKIAGRPVRPLARAPLFGQPLLGHLLRGLNALPVYRPQDFPGETWRNDETFDAAVDALFRHEAVLIFPEGLSHSEARIARMKTGAARLAFEAEEAVDWNLGLKVVPIGLTYHRKHSFRGRVAAAVGRPFEVAGWREMRERDEWSAVESLTAAMREALEQVTLNLPTQEDRILIETAEALYAAEKRLAEPRGRQALGPRLPRLQQFAHALAWLHVADPERYARLTGSVRAYRQELASLGVAEGELPERFPALGVIRYALTHFLVLLVGLPLAALGTVAWYLAFKSPRVTLSLYRPAYEVVASFKLATALIAFPATYALWLIAAWLAGGLVALIVVAVLLPLLGLIAMRWQDRWGRVREDARIFWRAMRKKELREQLVNRRRALVDEFDAVARQWQAEQRGRRSEPA